MQWHKVDKYIGMRFHVKTYKKRGKKNPRIFEMGELDGFYVDSKLDRTVHITFEEEDIIVIDIYDTDQAAIKPFGETLGIIELNIRTGEAKFFKEGR